MKSIYEYFKKVLSENADRIAVDDCTEAITFKELDQIAAIMATAISNANEEKMNCPILVYIPKSYQAIATFLGINFSGNFYVPIDMKQPDLRIQRIKSVMGANCVVTLRSYVEKLLSLGFEEKEILVYEDVIETVQADGELIESIQERVIDTDPLYVKFTSGSSGEPKGVVLNQRAVIDYIIYFQKIIGMNNTQISGCISPLHFDNSVHDVYGMFCCGSTIVLMPDKCMMFPKELVDVINEKKINVLWWPTTAIVLLATSHILEKQTINHPIDIVTNAGEVLQVKYYNQILPYFKNTKFYNIYGPTETAVTSSVYLIDRKFDDNESFPIGKPFPNTDIFLLDESKMKVSEPDVIGEICIRGSSLAGGYYNNSEKTSQAFVQNPLNPHYPELIYLTGDLGKYDPNGELLFIGRKDFQIKHKGARIELGEIEAAAASVDSVNECCVIYNQEAEKIVLFYSAVEEIHRKTLLSGMLKQIPKNMLPEEIYYFEQLPKNANGKIDRVKLKTDYKNLSL